MRRPVKATVFAVAALGLAAVPTQAQTDIALSGYGAFTPSTTTSSVIEHPASQGGFLVELRHISNPLVGYEVNYGFNRANETYASAQTCTRNCTGFAAAVPADAHEITADWVVSLKILNFKPFALAGGGALVTVPQGGTLRTTICGTICTTSNVLATTRTETKGIFNYGAGFDATLIPHVGVRFQYRGRLSKAPDLVTAFSSTNRFRNTAEPVFGVFLRF